MDRINHKISLDFQQRGAVPKIYANQNEIESRAVDIALFNAGSKWTAPAGITVVMSYIKPDGIGGEYDHLPDDSPAWSFNADRSEVVVKLAPQMFTTAGEVHCKVRFVTTASSDPAQVLSTFRFDLVCDRDSVSGESEPYFSVKSFDEMYQAIDEAKADAAEALAAGLHDITAEYVAAKTSRPTLTVDAFLLEQDDGLYRINAANGRNPYIARVVTDALGQTHMDVVEYSQSERVERIYINSTLITTVAMDAQDGAVTINPESLVVNLETALANIAGLQSTVGGHSTKLNMLQLMIETNSEDIADLRNDVGSIETQVAVMRSDVDVLNAAVFGVVPDPSNWAAVKAAVQAGFGKKLFPVGYEFVIPHQVMGDSVWVVRGHDYDPLGTELTDGRHNMLLEMKKAYGAPNAAYTDIQFDQREAFYYAENGLAAGTYTFHIKESYPNWVVGDYQFTLDSAVPAGGQLVFSGDATAALTSRSVQVFANGASTTASQTVPITAGNGGTFLGNTGVIQSKCDVGFNSLHRASYGSNNYAQSAVRQWLNSDAVAGSVWAQQTVFDRIANWGASASTVYQGLKRGFSNDFLQAVVSQKLPCRTNSVFEVNGYTTNTVYNIQDAFFLLSRPEVYGSWDSELYKDGTQLEYYVGLADTDRILYDNIGTARNKWLRSPHPGYAHYARSVYAATGEIYGSVASGAYGVAPACIIG